MKTKQDFLSCLFQILHPILLAELQITVKEYVEEEQEGIQKGFDQHRMEGGGIHENLLEHKPESLFLKNKIWNEAKKLWLAAYALVFTVIFRVVLGVQLGMVNGVGTLCQFVYITGGGCRETWKGFTALAFEDLGRTIRLSVSSGVMICLEFCYNTVLILLAGNMGNAEVTIDALSICLNISGWALMVAFGVQPVLSGVANGAGQQGIVAYVNLASYYLIGLPLGVILGYVLKLQVEGVWIGIIMGTAVQTGILVWMTCNADWDKQISLAQKRITPISLQTETSSP
ncbi:protein DETOXIFICATION 21-like isoform X2 [Salvia divinorum]|uniref:Protein DETOXIFICATION 21-like isoform X2 n=1 Tax=Salvia divinorum TaxID=28513 RepID=A0ABD1HFU9_SALDI